MQYRRRELRAPLAQRRPNDAVCLVVIGVLLSGGCTGVMSSQSEAEEPGGSDGGGGVGEGGSKGGGASGTDGPAALGAVSLRRLTKREFENTIFDLLKAPASYALNYPKDDVSKYGFATATNTSDLVVTTSMETADELSRFAVGRINELVPCAAAANDACAKELIDSFGERAFRRPLSDSEQAQLFGLYQFARGELALDFQGATRVLLSAMLQAPQFLYHWEVGDEPLVSKQEGTVQLGSFQLASRLSYFLWGSMPDAPLFAAAKDGSLMKNEVLKKHAERMLADARARGMVADFFTQMLYLDGVLRAEKDSKGHPEWTAALRASALSESRAFTQAVVFDGDGMWSSLMTADYSFVDEPLAKLYGVGAVTGSMLKRSTLPQGQRSGILTQASFLAAHSGPSEGALVTPIHRGEAIRKRLLCQPIPPPLLEVTSRPSSGTTTRERLQSHVSDPQCAACHVLMDDLGFAFENYDVTGKWRTMDNGKPVDAKGEISGLDSGTPKFINGIELAKALATSPEALECAVSNLLRYGLGRLDTEGEAKALLKQLGQAEDLNIPAAVVAVVTSPGFSTRVLAKGEVQP